MPSEHRTLSCSLFSFPARMRLAFIYIPQRHVCRNAVWQQNGRRMPRAAMHPVSGVWGHVSCPPLSWICVLTRCILGEDSVVLWVIIMHRGVTMRSAEADPRRRLCVCVRGNQIFVNEREITPSSFSPTPSPYTPPSLSLSLYLLCQQLPSVCAVIKMIGSCELGSVCVHVGVCICLRLKFNPAGLRGWAGRELTGKTGKCQRSLTSFSVTPLAHI